MFNFGELDLQVLDVCCSIIIPQNSQVVEHHFQKIGTLFFKNYTPIFLSEN